MKRSKIYTKAGDEGYSSLYTGERLEKNDLVFEALGDVDELNSSIGLCLSVCNHADLSDIFTYIQSRLIDVGSCLAIISTSEDIEKIQRVQFDPDHVNRLEEFIDLLDSQLPELTKFILPSGGEFSSRAHMARSICRRAERSVIGLHRRQPVSESARIFLNRLSDLLFVIARTAASREGVTEITYKKST